MRSLDKNPIYYVYAHCKPGCDEPFLIGKGKFRRAWIKNRPNKMWKNIVDKYGGFEVKILLNELSESSALCMEAMYINAYGRRDQGKVLLLIILMVEKE